MFSGGLHHSLASIEYGDPFLKKEKTHKILFDFEKNDGKFNFRINPYFSYSDNYILLNQLDLNKLSEEHFQFGNIHLLFQFSKG